MSKQVEELLRKAVEHAKRAGALNPRLDSEIEDHAAQLELEARRLNTGGTPNQS